MLLHQVYVYSHEVPIWTCFILAGGYVYFDVYEFSIGGIFKKGVLENRLNNV